MRLWIIGIVVMATLGFMLSDVGIIESNSMHSTPASITQTTPTAAVKQDMPAADVKILEKELGEQMAVLASHYQQNIRFPHYSTPINEGQTDLLEPLKALPVSLNLGKDVDDSAQLSPEQFNYKQGDIIKATLSSSGRIQPTQVSIELVENNKTLSRFSVTEKDNAYLAILDSKGKDWPVDLHIKATFNFAEHGRLAILSPIKYSPDNGTILSISKAYVDGVNLSIPVQLNINESGRYRLTANFFSQDKSPIAHLTAKQNLKKGKNTWTLQVHSEVLRAANNPGPYILDTWTLTKLPERPGIRTSYGDSNISAEKIEGFALNQYDTTPWSDPQDEARLEFLQKLQ
ncbi:DUF4785 family immunoglobulin-like domain-containing protein [Pseudomonas sp. HK3]